MSLMFDADSEHVALADPRLDLLDALTLMMWYRAETVASATYTAMSKRYDASGDQLLLWRPSLSPGPDDWSFFHRRTTTSTFVRTGANLIQPGRWEWICVLESDGVAPRILHGTLSQRPIEPAYYSRTTGVGSVSDDSGQAMNLGRAVSSGTQTFRGEIGFVALYGRRMSEAEAAGHWLRPRPASGCLLFAYPGLHGLSFVDLSGGNIAGSVQGGVTLGQPVPLPMPRLRHFNAGSPASPSRMVALGGMRMHDGRMVLAG